MKRYVFKKYIENIFQIRNPLLRTLMHFEAILIPDLVGFFLNTIGREEKGVFLSIIIEIRRSLIFEGLYENNEQCGSAIL